MSPNRPQFPPTQPTGKPHSTRQVSVMAGSIAAVGLVVGAMIGNGTASSSDASGPPETRTVTQTVTVTTAVPTTVTVAPAPPPVEPAPLVDPPVAEPPVAEPPVEEPPVAEEPAPPPETAYYANCDAARAAGAAPLYAGEPGYRAGLDRDGDGVACE